MKHEEQSPNKLNIDNTKSYLLVTELENFFNEMVEDWHLWDDLEQGPYQIQRTFDAMTNFINYHKTK